MIATASVPAVAIATLVVALAGCGSDSNDDAGGSAETREVETDFGTVTLPTEPQAALGMYTTDVDMLITLDIPLAKAQPVRDTGYSEFPPFFPQDELAGIETFRNYPEYNYEAILDAGPDFILNGLGYDAEVVKRLPEIAPTYSIDAHDGTDWREKFKQIATDLDRAEQYDTWMNSYEQKVKDVKARLNEAGVDPVVAPMTYENGTVTLNCYGVPCLVFDDLGLRISPLTDGDGTQLSLEQLEQLDEVDAMFRPVVPGDEATPPDLDGNPLWNDLPFVENDSLHPFDLEMLFGSPSGQEAFLEVVEHALLD